MHPRVFIAVLIHLNLKTRLKSLSVCLSKFSVCTYDSLSPLSLAKKIENGKSSTKCGNLRVQFTLHRILYLEEIVCVWVRLNFVL